MTKSILTDEQIKSRFNELLTKPDLSPQKRGFEFEKLIRSKLENENLEPKAGYKPKGEQVDGSFFWNGSTYLLEAKWVKDKVPASSIYSFKGKVDGKFHTTSGVFISINGFSDDAYGALKSGKSLNVLLFDSEDVKLIFSMKASFIDVLKYKLREAGDTGNINAPYKLSLEIEEIKESDLVEVLVFVEGQTDVQPVSDLISHISFGQKFNYRIIPLYGAKNLNRLPTLINIYGEHSYLKTVLVVLDKDYKSKNGKRSIKKIKKSIRNSSMSIDTKFFFLSDLSKANSELVKIQNYVDSVFDEYYFEPETDISSGTLKGLMKIADWDFEEKIIRFPDDSGRDVELKSSQELIEYLNEAIVSQVGGSMPLSWLKEQSYLDYEDEAREYIWGNFGEDLVKLEWVNEY